MVAVATVAVVLGLVESLSRPYRVHRQWYQRVEADIRSLQQRRPPDVSREEWAYVIGYTLNAHGNCASHPSFLVDVAALGPFADALEQRLRGEVDMSTIDWIWDQYVRISRVGPSYDRFRPTSPERLQEAKQFHWAGIEVD